MMQIIVLYNDFNFVRWSDKNRGSIWREDHATVSEGEPLALFQNAPRDEEQCCTDQTDNAEA